MRCLVFSGQLRTVLSLMFGLVGASVSEPHTTKSNCNFIYIYICRPASSYNICCHNNHVDQSNSQNIGWCNWNFNLTRSEDHLAELWVPLPSWVQNCCSNYVKTEVFFNWHLPWAGHVSTRPCFFAWQLTHDNPHSNPPTATYSYTLTLDCTLTGPWIVLQPDIRTL